MGVRQGHCALHEPMAGYRQLVRSWPGRQDQKGGSSGGAAGALLVPSPDPTAFLMAEAGGTEVKTCRRKKRHDESPSFLYSANISGAQALWGGHG